MKKKLIIIGLVIIIITGGIIFKNGYFGNIDSNEYLSSIEEDNRSIGYNGTHKSNKNGDSFEFKEFNGKWSLMKISSSKGNEIIIKDSTKISKGKFYIVVLDSNHNIIAKKNELKDNGDIKFTTANDGEYYIRIVGLNASGNFNVSINAKNNIKVSHKNFFD